MPVPSNISELSTSAASNSPNGAADSPAILDDIQRAHAAFIAQLRDGQAALSAEVQPIARGGTGAITAAAARTALDVPTRTGGDASGTWGISITGNAATATTSTTSTTPASTTVSGVVELATSAEVQAGADTDRAVTPSGFSASSLGYGQTWQNVSGSRTSSTNYTNSTGRPIEVIVCGQSGFTGGSSAMTLTVAGVVVSTRTNNESSGASYQGLTGPVSAIVPNGAVYRIDPITGGLTIISWVELR